MNRDHFEQSAKKETLASIQPVFSFFRLDAVVFFLPPGDWALCAPELLVDQVTTFFFPQKAPALDAHQLSADCKERLPSRAFL